MSGSPAGHQVVQGQEHGQRHGHHAGQADVFGSVRDFGCRCRVLLVEGGGGGGGTRGVDRPTLARGPVLVVAADAHARPAAARARGLVPLALKVGGARGLDAGQVGLAAALAGVLVEDLVVVAVEDGALAAAGAAVLLDLDAGAEVAGLGGVGADDDVDPAVPDLLGLTQTSWTFEAETWKTRSKFVESVIGMSRLSFLSSYFVIFQLNG